MDDLFDDPSNQKSVRSRKKCEIWDCVEALFYEGCVPKSFRKAVGQLVRDLKELKATPQEIRKRAAAYREKWPKMTPTLRALVGNWSQFSGKATPKPRRNEGIEDESKDYVYLAAMKKWKAENGG